MINIGKKRFCLLKRRINKGIIIISYVAKIVDVRAATTAKEHKTINRIVPKKYAFLIV